jgi:hypothetical protein
MKHLKYFLALKTSAQVLLTSQKFHAFRRTNRTSTWNRRIIFHFNVKEPIFKKLACVTGIFTYRRFEVYNDYTGCELNA